MHIPAFLHTNARKMRAKEYRFSGAKRVLSNKVHGIVICRLRQKRSGVNEGQAFIACIVEDPFSLKCLEIHRSAVCSEHMKMFECMFWAKV